MFFFFQHPNAGIQIPAGRVEDDEPLERAVLRKVAEETGLTSVQNIRHILACEEETAACWSVYTDNHLFQPFWAPLADLPEIIPPQCTWLDFVQVTCGYSIE